MNKMPKKKSHTVRRPLSISRALRTSCSLCISRAL